MPLKVLVKFCVNKLYRHVLTPSSYKLAILVLQGSAGHGVQSLVQPFNFPCCWMCDGSYVVAHLRRHSQVIIGLG